MLALPVLLNFFHDRPVHAFLVFIQDGHKPLPYSSHPPLCSRGGGPKAPVRPRDFPDIFMLPLGTRDCQTSVWDSEIQGSLGMAQGLGTVVTEYLKLELGDTQDDAQVAGQCLQ